jgi:hypothetical protein
MLPRAAKVAKFRANDTNTFPLANMFHSNVRDDIEIVEMVHEREMKIPSCRRNRPLERPPVLYEAPGRQPAPEIGNQCLVHGRKWHDAMPND